MKIRFGTALGPAGFVLACVSLVINGLLFYRIEKEHALPPAVAVGLPIRIEPARPQALTTKVTGSGMVVLPSALAAPAGLPAAQALQTPAVLSGSSTVALVGDADACDPVVVIGRSAPSGRNPLSSPARANLSASLRGGASLPAPNASSLDAEGPAIAAPAANSRIPAAFEPSTPSSSPTAQQAAQVGRIQNEFAENVSAGRAASIDSASWETAVTTADEQYRAWFGDEAFVAHQVRANRNAGRPDDR